MNVRSLVGSLQLPVAGIGALVCLGAVAAILSLSPPEGEGFVRGLAVVFLYGVAWIGFVVAALGLALPPAEGLGVRFTRWQRRLFIAAAGLAVLSVVSPLLFWPVVAATGMALGTAAIAWVVVMGLAVLSLATGLGWRVIQGAMSTLRTRDLIG